MPDFWPVELDAFNGLLSLRRFTIRSQTTAPPDTPVRRGPAAGCQRNVGWITDGAAPNHKTNHLTACATEARGPPDPLGESRPPGGSDGTEVRAVQYSGRWSGGGSRPPRRLQDASLAGPPPAAGPAEPPAAKASAHAGSQAAARQAGRWYLRPREAPGPAHLPSDAWGHCALGCCDILAVAARTLPRWPAWQAISWAFFHRQELLREPSGTWSRSELKQPHRGDHARVRAPPQAR